MLSLSSLFLLLILNNIICQKQYYSHTKKESNLLFVFYLFRHGARSPTIYINFDIKFNFVDKIKGNWNESGILTKTGKKQCFDLGYTARERYSNLIDVNNPNDNELEIYSTNYRRVLHSLEFFLKGLFTKPYKNYSILPGAKLHKEHIYSFPQYNNYYYLKENNYNNFFTKTFFLSMTIYEHCPKLFEIKANNVKDKNSPGAIKFYQKYDNNEEIHKFIKHFNIPYTFETFVPMCDTIISNLYSPENMHILENIGKLGFNMTKIIESCIDFNYIYQFEYLHGNIADNSGLIEFSPTFKQILVWIRQAINGEKNRTKFVAVAGHDNTLTSMQNYLHNVFDNISYEGVPFGSFQALELRKYNNEYYVEIYFNDILKLNKTFKEFSSMIESKSWNEEQILELCYNDQKNSYIAYIMYHIYNNIYIIIAIICIIIFIIILYCIKKNRKNDMKYKKMKDNNDNDIELKNI